MQPTRKANSPHDNWYWISSQSASEMALSIPLRTGGVSFIRSSVRLGSALDRGTAAGKAPRGRWTCGWRRWQAPQTCVPALLRLVAWPRGGGEYDSNNKSYLRARFLKNTRWAGWLWQWCVPTLALQDKSSTLRRAFIMSLSTCIASLSKHFTLCYFLASWVNKRRRILGILLF